MATLYDLIILGSPEPSLLSSIESEVESLLSNFSMTLGVEVGWHVWPLAYVPIETSSAAALFFGAVGAPIGNTWTLLSKNIPVIPLISHPKKVADELPPDLGNFNAMLTSGIEAPRKIAADLLGAAGLLPRQRRVFVSYRRDEATPAALRLFAELSARGFEVFLDTHRIGPGQNFQNHLWHKLCESDLLVMLDTKTYFSSRWTTAEFGRALAKGISVLQISWPSIVRDPRIKAAAHISLQASDVSASGKDLLSAIIPSIASRIEALRAFSIAVRNLNLVANIRSAMEILGGKVTGLGRGRAVFLELPDGSKVVAYPETGIPTSVTMHDAVPDVGDPDTAVVYDHVGVLETHVEHLEWLGTHVKGVRWVRAERAAWDFADWWTK